MMSNIDYGTLSPNNTTADDIIRDAVSQPSEAEIAKQQAQAEELSKKQQIEEFFKAHRVLVSEDIPEEPAFLAVQDPVTSEFIPICGKYDLVTVKAAPKNGKTTLFSIMIAAMLCGQWGRVRSYFEKPRILYIDTEMKRKDTQRIGRMSLTMADMDPTTDLEGFFFINLRKLTVGEIKEHLEEMIDYAKPDIVFIDGVLDLCSNFNDPEESMTLVKDVFLKLIDQYHFALIVAIHTNKTNDTHASQGHLGAALDKKGEMTLECEMDRKSRIIKVTAPYCRHTTLPELYYRYSDNGCPIPGDKEYAENAAQQELSKVAKKEAKEKADLEDWSTKVKTFMSNVGSEGIPQQQLANQLKDALGLGLSTVQERIKKLVNAGILTREGYNGNLVFAGDTAPLK